MKIFDKIFRKRDYARPSQAHGFYRGFAAAQNSRLTADWILSSSASADSEIYQSLAIVRSRARDLCNNNDYAKKYLQLCQNNVVGPDGFILQNKAKDTNGEFDRYANMLIEEKFWDWQKKNHCTVSGIMPFADVLDLIIKTVVRDGEIFIRKIRGRNVNKYGFSLQVIEPDFIDEKYNSSLGNGNVIRMGIELDQNRRPVAYYVKKVKAENELYSISVGSEHERIPAEDMYHLYDRERANQTRGISWMVASMFRLRMLSKFEEYALINARISASKMGFFKRSIGDGEYTGDDKDESGNLRITAEPGSFEELPAGMDFVPFTPQFPSDQHDAFVKSILRAIASGLGVSYNTIANDLEGVNYSSIRAGLLDERDNWKRIQRWLIENFLNGLFADWLSMALLTGEVNLPSSKFDKFNQPAWIGRRWQWVDPMKDVMANKEAVKNGFKTNAQVIGELGGDIYEIYEQLKSEQALQKEYGLKLGDING